MNVAYLFFAIAAAALAALGEVPLLLAVATVALSQSVLACLATRSLEGLRCVPGTLMGLALVHYGVDWCVQTAGLPMDAKESLMTMATDCAYGLALLDLVHATWLTWVGTPTGDINLSDGRPATRSK